MNTKSSLLPSNCGKCLFVWFATNMFAWTLNLNAIHPFLGRIESKHSIQVLHSCSMEIEDCQQCPCDLSYEKRAREICRYASTVPVCGTERIVINQLCRIVVGILSQFCREGHQDMGDVSTYGKIIRNLLGSMKPPGSNLCADTRRYKELRSSQSVKTERVLHWVERGLTF